VPPEYDVAVAYRIYPKVSRVPPVFPNDKYKLSELCLKSFKDSLGSLKVKMFVLLDNCPPSYEDLFKRYFDEQDLEFIRLNGVGNRATFDMQIETSWIKPSQKLSILLKMTTCISPINSKVW